MAVIINPMDSKLKIKYQIGVDDNGNSKYKTKTYSNIKTEAMDEDVFAVAQSLANLQQYMVEDFRRVDEKEIAEEE